MNQHTHTHSLARLQSIQSAVLLGNGNNKVNANQRIVGVVEAQITATVVTGSGLQPVQW
jgi:hypothetical protein